MNQLNLMTDQRTNFLMHMLRLAHWPESEYSRRYEHVHNSNNLKTLRANLDLLTLNTHHADPATKEIIHTLLFDSLCEETTDDAFTQMSWAALRIISLDKNEDSVFYPPREENEPLLLRAFQVAQALENECSAYESLVWPTESEKINQVVEQLKQRAEQEQLVPRTLERLDLKEGELDEVTIVFSGISYGSTTSIQLEEGFYLEMSDNPDGMYASMLMSFLHALMTCILVQLGETEPKPMEGYVAVGLMMYYHKCLTGNRRYFKHYTDVISRCEALEAHGKRNVADLYYSVLADLAPECM